MLTDEKLARKRAENAKGYFTRRLSDDSLFHIATHKYKSGAYTPIDNLMNPFWLWCAQLIPSTLLKKGAKGDGSDDFVNSSFAPNIVTLLGLFFNVFAYFLIGNETNFNMKGDIRPWVNFTCGITLFLYQTLDAMDGKHARRTKNGSPLGQLFDHGCDALSTPLCSIIFCTTLQTGPTPLAIYALAASQLPFYIAQLAESRTGTMQHSMGGVVGVTETQLVIIFTHVISAFLPISFWTTPIGTLEMFGYPDIEIQPNELFIYGGLIPSGSFMVITTLLSTPTDSRLFLELLSVLVPSCLLIYTCSVLNTNLMVLYPHYILMMIALSTVYVTTQRIVLNMGHGTFSLLQPNLFIVAFGLFFMSDIIEFLTQTGIGMFQNLNGLMFVQYLMLQSIVTYGSWVIDVISEICSVLDLQCLIPIQHKLDGKRL